MVSYPNLHFGSATPITIADTTAETVVGSLTIPGGIVQPGTAFIGQCTGIANTGNIGSPSITANLRIGGLSGTLIASNTLAGDVEISELAFQLFFTAGVVTTGTAGTWVGSVTEVDILTGAGLATVAASTTPVTHNTLVTTTLVMTLAWPQAESGNTMSNILASIMQVN